MEEIEYDATYEEFFGAKPEEERPRVAIIAVVQPVPPPAQTIPPAIEAEDDNGDTLSPEVRFLNHTFQTHRTNALKRKSPSVAAKSTNYTQIQGSPDGLLDGRFAPDGPATAAYPIELFHPAFATYQRDSEDSALDVPPDIVREVAALMRTLSAVAEDEVTRDMECRRLLANILGTTLDKVINSNGTSPSFTSLIQTPIDTTSATPVILENKSELDSGGSDPSLEVSFSYEQLCCAPERATLLEQTNCPSFLIGLAGPWIVICGAVMIHRTIVQRLSAYEWHACSRVGDDARVLVVARRLFALRNGIAMLKDYYAGLQPAVTQLNVNRYFPSITSYIDENDETVEFRYVQPLEMDILCIVFLAQRLDNDEDFVVKFVSRYNADAHRHMAAGGFAPQLLCHQPLGPGYGDWALVAMDRVDGETISSKYEDGPLPAQVRDAIQNALRHLRLGKYIMPDLRRPNVMLVNGEEPVNKRVRFVDFDWACVEGGGARYPFHLSREVRESAKAKEYDEITRLHEQNMFDKNF